ncbi:glycoside hydrolase family 31 protein [Flagelloscypha sp. PMI_526]|nr:glycoside hydrolase family 31 protein [Flagelloscypha sp. PMI_526]
MLSLLVAAVAFVASVTKAQDLDSCPGYSATNVKTTQTGLTATLSLAGTPCNVYGNDTKKLALEVTYETTTRLHVKISDSKVHRYEVPESVFPRPKGTSSAKSSQIQFKYTTSPFSFSIVRKSTGEALFSTGNHSLIVEPQYLRVKTDLPQDANLYGLGEHTNWFRLDPSNTTLTMWTRDAYVYFEQRTTGSHAVFLLNSDGMDIKLTPGALEYNVIGGLLDFYFLAGSETNPVETARQYSELVGRPAEMPYWGFGMHQCRFGYKDFVDVSEVITNYSAAGIPLETMWTDIDYMDRRRVFTLDPDYFPLSRMREIVSYLHKHDQHFIVMTDPAVYRPNGTEAYDPYTKGHEQDIFLKGPDGQETLSLVWPGVTVYPDWFNPATQDYWNNQFSTFYSAETGLDLLTLLFSTGPVQEPANFCDLPCTDPAAQAKSQNLPPPRTNPPPDPNAPIFQNSTSSVNPRGFKINGRADPDQNILNPPYRINNAAPTGNLSSKTAWVDAVYKNGVNLYDGHNLYGTLMSSATREAMVNRRPGKRPLIITRSTYAGAGRNVGKWLGDNLSTWWHYANSISGILGFAGLYQVPMVGADICGFGGNTTETLCARWATLGAWYPFMRNHNGDTSISQEFYRWPTVAQAAKNALSTRYKLLDYLYTSFHRASVDGTPVLQPVFFQYPQDASTYSIVYQFFFGDSILVSPVIDENSTSVNIYLPKDTFYDWTTLKAVQGQGATTLTDIDYTEIPVHIKGGSILPLRLNGTMTLAELRKTSFEFLVAPGASNGTASGQLYLDDGESIRTSSSKSLKLEYKTGKLTVSGQGRYSSGVKVAQARFLVRANGKNAQHSYDSDSAVLTVALGTAVEADLSVEFS